jgi:ABC-2 type transport system permease protein
MTTLLERRLPPGRYRFRDVAAMEWIKLRSLRSMTWTLTIGMAAMIAIGVATGFSTRSAASDATSNTLGGIVLGQIVVGVLGVLLMTGEYSSGLIRGTLAAVPRRPMVLAAKALVFGLVSLVASEIATFASFLGGIAALRSSVPHPALSDPSVLRAVVLSGAYLALTGLMGLGIGAIIRHTAGAVATLVGGLFVLPIIIGNAAGHSSGKFLPELIVGNSLSAVKPVQGFTWSPWVELAIVALYAVVLVGAGGWLLVRRDA